jgi:hypothetical protein
MTYRVYLHRYQPDRSSCSRTVCSRNLLDFLIEIQQPPSAFSVNHKHNFCDVIHPPQSVIFTSIL